MSEGVGHSVTIRLEMGAGPAAVSTVTATVEGVDAAITAVDVSASDPDRLQVDLTCVTAGDSAVERVLAALRRLPGVQVGRVSDRVFLAHLGGKLSIEPRTPIRHRDDLSLVYTPGVARVSMQVARNAADASRLTIKGNTVAVVSDGSAVLGLGNIGALGALPVMEGKAALFKRFAGIDAFPLCLDTQDVDDIVRTVRNVAPVFAGVNLEDISAPRCFEVERRLRDELDVPVFHDDQHGTAIVTLAALTNALTVVGKDIARVRIVQCGAGAAGSAVLRLLQAAGATDVTVVDAEGIIHLDRPGLSPELTEMASRTNPRRLRGRLSDAIPGADVFVGVSAANVLTEAEVMGMAPGAVVFALANPTPEIDPLLAARHAAVVATGRSDFANQINNVLAFPGVFRGLLDARSSHIDDRMLLAAASALAGVVTPAELNSTYIVPSVFHPDLHTVVARAVQEAAQEAAQE